MAKRGIACLAVIVCLQCLSYPHHTSVDPLSSDTEDYAVYSAVLNQVYLQLKPRLVVIERQTLEDNFSALNKFLHYKEKLSPLEDETIKDFDEKNRTSLQLRPLFKIPHEYLAMTEWRRLGSGVDPWRAFFRSYPKAQRLISFSRVGFNDSEKQALVYVSESGGSRRGGTGKYYVLSKEGSKWRIGAEYLVLIS